MTCYIRIGTWVLNGKGLWRFYWTHSVGKPSNQWQELRRVIPPWQPKSREDNTVK